MLRKIVHAVTILMEFGARTEKEEKNRTIRGRDFFSFSQLYTWAFCAGASMHEFKSCDSVCLS